MVYITGDIHGKAKRISQFCRKFDLNKEDVVIILGDVGINYFGPDSWQDRKEKMELAKLPCTIFCIQGNHEQRPTHFPELYHLKEWNGGSVWYETEFPNILFAKDGDIYNINDKKYLVIGGAYSVDKNYRLSIGGKWWKDEQPSQEIKKYVEEQVKINPSVDVVLTHTCPAKYIPVECFLSFVDQSTVDNSTEEWLDSIENQLDYKAWFCGHWHTTKHIDKMHFLFEDFESEDDIK